MTVDSAPRRLGPIELVPGITPANAMVFLYSAFIGITLNTFVNFIQPYVLTEQLLVPAAQQGRVSGDLVFYAEIMMLAACGVAGIAADRFGRRAVIAAGFLILAVGFSIYGYVDGFTTLLLLRLFFACGIACINVMVSTVQADYPVEASRGKFVGLTGVCIGIGALFLVFALAPMPSWFAEFADPIWAGRYTLLSVAAIALVSAAIVGFGLAKHNPGQVGVSRPSSLQALRIGIAAARENPRVALSYGCAFVARGDLIVIGVFFSLWVTQQGISQGMSSADAVKTAGMLFGIVQGSALLWAPVAGVINDRLDRLTAMRLALVAAAIGYGSLAFVDNPLSTTMYICAVLLGIGQMSVLSASQTLIGQECPEEHRGVVIAAFSICGALGIMFVTKVGGIVFDAWNPGPFVLVAGINIALFLISLAVTARRD
jgi:MFS family permease